MNRRLLIDLESDNLLFDATTIWVIVAKDVDTGEVFESTGDHSEMLERLRKASLLIAHNGASFDFPALRKLLGFQYAPTKVFDTLLASRLLCPDLEGGHSLSAWGKRLHCSKGEFNDFSQFSQEMLDYCRQDVEVLHKIFDYLEPKIDKIPKAWQIEQEFAHFIQLQIENGFTLDVEKAEELYKVLLEEYEALNDHLRAQMFPVKDLTHYRPLKAAGLILSEGPASYTYKTPKSGVLKEKEWRFDQPNPQSRQQIVEFLKNVADWKPTVFTEKGQAKVDETILKTVDHPEAQNIARMFRLSKQMGMIRNDNGGWLNYVRENNKVHGEVTTIGANTGRCTHCVPLDSQALTKEGWKSYNELQIGEEILGYDVNTNTKKWTKLTAVNVFTDAEVGELGNGNVRFRCTANHRWITYQNSRGKGYYRIKEAKDLKKYDAVLTNAPYSNPNKELDYELPKVKYGYPHIEDVLKFNKSQLHSFMLGFLLADGYLKKSTNGDTYSWSFAQAEGDILDTVHTAMYLYSDTRISKTCKNPLKGAKQRYGYNITQTQVAHVRSSEGMQWKYTNTEDVWCPTTELGTWVMKQGDIITITGNSKPNLAQIDKKDPRMRAVWIPAKGLKLVDCDASQLELRLLAHYLALYDYGLYASNFEKAELDIHTINQNLMGLHERDSAKTAIYALIYGAGNAKLGTIYCKDQGIRNPTERQTLSYGKQLRNNVEDNFTGYKELMQTISERIADRGFLIGVDGRPLHPRSDYSALNLLIQNAGAVVMKVALNLFMKEVRSQGLRHGREYALVANIHDEVVLEARPEIAEELGILVRDSIRNAGPFLNLKCPLDGAYALADDFSVGH